MPMVGVLIDERVGARIRIDGVRTNEMRAGDAVPELAIDGVDEKKFPIFIPIMSPRIGAAAAEDLDGLSPGMKPPDRAAHRDALGSQRARNANFARTRCTAASVKPAVRSEAQPV